MAKDRSILERQMERVELRPFTLEGFHRQRQRKQRNRKVGTALVALALAAAGIGGLVRTFSSEIIPASDPRSRFLGEWMGENINGITPTMVIRAPAGQVLQVVVTDGL